MANIKYYNDGKPVTLFDRRFDKKLQGSLMLVSSVPFVVPTLQSSNLREGFKKIAESISKILEWPVPSIPIPNISLPSISIPKISIDRPVKAVAQKTNAAHVIFHEKIGLLADKSKRINFSLAKTISKIMAIILLIIAVSGYIYSSLPLAFAEFNTKFGETAKVAQVITSASLNRGVPQASPYVVDSTALLPSPTPQAKVIDWEDFQITIPKINLVSDIIPNVDPNSEEAYKVALQNGVAHAKGSYLPGEPGTVFLFAHSTDTIADILKYNAKFYAVKDLQIDDDIVIEFDHKKYTYKVTDRKIVAPNDLESIRSSRADLVLSTCFPPGTNWQRLLIFATLTQTP